VKNIGHSDLANVAVVDMYMGVDDDTIKPNPQNNRIE